MNRTCPDNEHEFRLSDVVKGAEVCIHCGILRVPSEINHNYFEDWRDDSDDDYDEDED